MSEQCAATVYTGQGGGSACLNKAKVKDGNHWHCSTHSDAAVAKRKAARVARQFAQNERWDAERTARSGAKAKQAEIERRAGCYEPMLAALEEIADTAVQQSGSTAQPVEDLASKAIAAARSGQAEQARDLDAWCNGCEGVHTIAECRSLNCDCDQ